MRDVDRRLVAIIGVGVLLVITTLVIVFTAVVPTPEFEALPPGRQTGYVAYVEEGDEATSVRIVDLDTMSTTRARVDQHVELVGWDDDGNLVVLDWTFGERFLVIDPSTGEELGMLDSTERGNRLWDEGAIVYWDDGRIVVAPSDGHGTAAFTAPESYDVVSAGTLGDDRVVFVDELGRVAVADRGDDTRPLLVATGAQEWGRVAGRP